MNKLHLTSLLTASALISAPAFAGNTQSHKSRDSMDTVHSNTVSAISEDRLEQQFTANDLIGSDVYGPNGEKLGEVVNLTISDAQRLAPDSRDRSENAPVRDRSSDQRNSENYASSSASEQSNSAYEHDRRDQREAGMTNRQSGQSLANSSRRPHDSRMEAMMDSMRGNTVSVVVETDSGIFEDDTYFETPLSELRRNAEGELVLDLTPREIRNLTKSNSRDEYSVTDQG